MIKLGFDKTTFGHIDDFDLFGFYRRRRVIICGQISEDDVTFVIHLADRLLERVLDGEMVVWMIEGVVANKSSWRKADLKTGTTNIARRRVAVVAGTIVGREASTAESIVVGSKSTVISKIHGSTITSIPIPASTITITSKGISTSTIASISTKSIVWHSTVTAAISTKAFVVVVVGRPLTVVLVRNGKVIVVIRHPLSLIK